MNMKIYMFINRYLIIFFIYISYYKKIFNHQIKNQYQMKMVMVIPLSKPLPF